MVSAGFKMIRFDLHRFCWILIMFVDLGSFDKISTIWQIGVDLGIFEFGLVNLI